MNWKEIRRDQKRSKSLADKRICFEVYDLLEWAQRISRPPPSTTRPFLRLLSYLIPSPDEYCHYTILFTGRQLGYGAGLGVVVAVGIPHGSVAGRVPEHVLHGHEIDARA